jgi:hypothetical protein
LSKRIYCGNLLLFKAKKLVIMYGGLVSRLVFNGAYHPYGTHKRGKTRGHVIV